MNIKQLVSNYCTANPFEIAEKKGIEYEFKGLPGNVKGLLLSTPEDTPLVWINDKLRDSNLKYLVCAHELYHAMQHYGLNGCYSAHYGGKGKLETEADIFATKLMVELYKEHYSEYAETFDKLKTVYGIKEEMREYLI